MNKIVIAILIAVALIFGWVLFAGMSNQNGTEQPGPNTEEPGTNNGNADGNGNANGDGNGDLPNGNATGELLEYTLEAGEYAFNLGELRAREGDKVRVTLNNSGQMPHDFVIDEFNVKTNVLQPGESQTVEFTANQTGSFEFYCSVAGHRDQGMRGFLVIE